MTHNVNTIISANMPFLNRDGTVTWQWFRYLEALAAGASAHDDGDGVGFSQSGGAAPYFIPADETYTVPEWKQVLWTENIDVDGDLTVDGHLVFVD